MVLLQITFNRKMKNLRYEYFLTFMLFFMMISLDSCKSDYTRYVEKELARGIRNDSLIFGLSIGQDGKDFFDKCTELNKLQLITEGGGKNAKYIEPYDSLGDNTKRKEMLFYALFTDDNKIYGMRMTFSYLSWTLWNEEFHSDKLMVDIKDKMMRDYGGNEFIEVDLNNGGLKTFVKIDGNRRIVIVPKDKKDVYVKIEDLNYVMEQKNSKEYEG